AEPDAAAALVGGGAAPAPERGRAAPAVTVVSLAETFGTERARSDTAACIARAVRDHLANRSPVGV
ncbi:MAG TPA: hypothetical protein DEP66_07495, partial [Acidimicrobiaceae bacterium]|nr:hypothetical protein [Acidimicrobiaceae bacterium]